MSESPLVPERETRERFDVLTERAGLTLERGAYERMLQSFVQLQAMAALMRRGHLSTDEPAVTFVPSTIVRGAVDV